jgi:hypothetical protein
VLVEVHSLGFDQRTVLNVLGDYVRKLGWLKHPHCGQRLISAPRSINSNPTGGGQTSGAFHSRLILLPLELTESADTWGPVVPACDPAAERLGAPASDDRVAHHLAYP